MPDTPRFPSTLSPALLLSAMLLWGSPALTASAGASSERLDSAITADHDLHGDAGPQGDSASAQASRAATGGIPANRTSNHDGLSDSQLLDQDGQQPAADAQTGLEYKRRQAQAALNRHDPERALLTAQEALRAMPDDARLRFLKGLALFQLKRLTDAEHEFSTLIEDFPELPEPYNNLAVTQAAQGRLEAARDTLEAAIHAVPDYEVAYQNLGDLYLQLAAQRWRQAQAISSNTTRAGRLKTLDALLASGKAATHAAATPAAKSSGNP